MELFKIYIYAFIDKMTCLDIMTKSFFVFFCRNKMSRNELTVRCLTEEDEYKCPLSDETQAIAEEELRETENARSQALTSLRSWIKQNPKLMAIRMGKAYLIFIKFM